MPRPRKHEYTDAFIEGEFYLRFMRWSPEARRAKLLALAAADKLAAAHVDAKPTPAPLFEDPQPEVSAE